ncbi:hypothetical protein GF312_02490 [Candidatus Poribacteria bacterium]|nr:hypothetical protein [Candidatus Poribacteria bacterium]
MLNYKINDSEISIETNALHAKIQTEGYVSGISAGTLMDKKTNARDLGFGLCIVDFLLEPGKDEPGETNTYDYGDLYHGDIPKRYVELPQICTGAKKLPYEIVKAENFIAVKLWYKWKVATYGRKPGSLWEQILVFPENTRYFFCADRVTSVNTVKNLSLRVDMPGHLKHNKGDSFSQIYLSYYGTIPNTDFLEDFPPDARYRYLRGTDPMPERFIRAYQTLSGTWLAGMTLNPAGVSEAWCHQRGYVCFIQENGREEVNEGETFSTAYVVGFFDSIEEMEKVYDHNIGLSDIILEPSFKDARSFKIA